MGIVYNICIRKTRAPDVTCDTKRALITIDNRRYDKLFEHTSDNSSQNTQSSFINCAPWSSLIKLADVNFPPVLIKI